LVQEELEQHTVVVLVGQEEILVLMGLFIVMAVVVAQQELVLDQEERLQE
jgi:hypothetical protein